MESDVTVLCGRLKAVCEACSQTVPGINGAAELHAELSAQLKLSWYVSYVVSYHAAPPSSGGRITHLDLPTAQAGQTRF